MDKGKIPIDQEFALTELSPNVEKKNSGGVSKNKVLEKTKKTSSENIPLKTTKPPKIPKVLRALNGIKCCAAGVIPFDKTGIWLVLEEIEGKVMLNDMGGRCTTTDVTIEDTAIRTFNEESLGISPLSQLSLEKAKRFPIGIGPQPNRSYYASFFVPASSLDQELTEEKFEEKRKEEVEKTKQEPLIKALKHVNYEKLTSFKHQMSWRLKRTLDIVEKKTRRFQCYDRMR